MNVPLPQVLYIIKMFIFSRQMGYEGDLTEKLRRMVQFIILLYARAWLQAPLAGDAPANDLRLYRELVSYKRVDKSAAEAALRVLRRHVWYLRPQLVVFSLFSKETTLTEKAAISVKLLVTPRTDDFDSSEVESALLLDETTVLADLVDDSSWLLFEVASVGHEWLQKPPTEWNQDAGYNIMKGFVETVKVTNDVAERGIALLKDFAGKTKTEPQFQWLLQAVERHRTQLPAFAKAALNNL